MTERLKITVVRMFGPDEVFGPDHGITYEGGEIPARGLELGQEFMVEDQRWMPEGFCGRAWHDSYSTLMIYYYGGDLKYPEKGVTYQPCGDGFKPVVFRTEKIG